MAIYLESNAQGGGIVTESGSEQGIHFNNDNSWYIETKSISYVDQTPYAVRACTEVIDGYPPTFAVYNYTGNLDSSANLSSSIRLGSGFVGLGADSLVDNGNRVQPRISLDATGGQEDLSLEVEHNQSATYTNGIYINCSDEENAGISFRDYTIDPESPNKKYFLKDFALKTDIPAGVDLANYTGEVNLSDNYIVSTSDEESNLYSYNISSNFSLHSEDETILQEIPEEYLDLYKGPYISNAVTSSDTNAKISLSLALLNPGLYYYNHTTLCAIQIINPKFIYVKDYINRPNENYANVSAGERLSGNYGVDISAKGEPTTSGSESNVAGSADLSIWASGSHAGIEFRQNNLNNGQAITLESILNRIAQLESTVTELQTQLASKANTANPAFTGKVSVNNQ